MYDSCVFGVTCSLLIFESEEMNSDISFDIAYNDCRLFEHFLFLCEFILVDNENAFVEYNFDRK